MYKGTTYTVTFEHKPTKKEIMQAVAAEMESSDLKKTQMTFLTAAESYIASKRNVLSPSTIREYNGTLSRLSKNYTKQRISDVTALDVQKEINT